MVGYMIGTLFGHSPALLDTPGLAAGTAFAGTGFDPHRQSADANPISSVTGRRGYGYSAGAHSPLWSFCAPAINRWQSLEYVMPSQPQTGS